MARDDWDARWDEAGEALERVSFELAQAGERGWSAFCEVDLTSRPADGGDRGRVKRRRRPGRVPIDNGVAVPALVSIRRGTTTVVVDNSGDRPRYRVTIETGSPNLLDRLHLRSLVEQGLAHATVTTEDQLRFPEIRENGEVIVHARPGVLPAGSWTYEPQAARRYVRAEVTERDVERAAEAYNAGGIEELKRVMHVGTRQAWRYVTRGQDAGLIERKRARRRTKGTS